MTMTLTHQGRASFTIVIEAMETGTAMQSDYAHRRGMAGLMLGPGSVLWVVEYWVSVKIVGKGVPLMRQGIDRARVSIPQWPEP